MSVTKIILILSHVPVFAVALYAAFIYKTLPTGLKLFSWFLFCSGILQLISLILWFQGINNLFILHLLVPLGFVFLTAYYRNVLEGFLNKTVLSGTAIGFVIFSVINTVFFQPLSVFNSFALTTSCVVLIILSLSTYMLLLDKSSELHRRPSYAGLNRINSGLFIYHASTLLIFYFGEYITSHIGLELSRYTWVAHSFFSVVMYYCFWRGLWNRAVI